MEGFEPPEFLMYQIYSLALFHHHNSIPFRGEYRIRTCGTFTSASLAKKYDKPLCQLSSEEGEGFEPSELLHPSVFKTDAINQTLPPFLMYLWWDSNPHEHCCSQDFKSCVSTNSTTEALYIGHV